MIPGCPPGEVTGQRLRPVQGRLVTAENASVLAERVTAGQPLCRPPVGPVEMITASPRAEVLANPAIAAGQTPRTSATVATHSPLRRA